MEFLQNGMVDYSYTIAATVLVFSWILRFFFFFQPVSSYHKRVSLLHDVIALLTEWLADPKQKFLFLRFVNGFFHWAGAFLA